MAFVSKRDEIKKAIDAKLRTIQTAAGYQTNVAKVFADSADDDKVPMGLDLDESEVPSIISYAGDDSFGPGKGGGGTGLVHGCVFGNFELELQLWHAEVSDSEMHAFVRDVFKALFAGTASGTVRNAFRSLHPKLYDLRPLKIEHDLNMIDGNRCFIIDLIAQYQTELYDL